MAEARLEDFPALGFVPCPGDHVVADSVAKTVRRTAKALVEICHVLHGTGVGDWEGKAAKAFRETFDDEFRPRMDDARDSFRGAASALEDWADYMERKQRAAVKLEAEAAVVAKSLKDAYDKADKLNDADDKKKDTKDHEGKVKEAMTEDIEHWAEYLEVLSGIMKSVSVEEPDGEDAPVADGRAPGETEK